MKDLSKLILALSLVLFFNCEKDNDGHDNSVDTSVNFSHRTTINVGGEGASEITAYDAVSKKLFTVNVEGDQISVTNISNLDAAVQESPIDLTTHGSPNSVSVYDGILVVAVEANPKQNPGKIMLFSTNNNAFIKEFTVGALPDMVTFSKNGKLVITAN